MQSTPIIPQGYRQCDAQVLKQQIGTMNILAISGGRVGIRPTGITLPIRQGYSVTVDLAANDTYTVRRVFARGGKVWDKGTVIGVYCDQVGEVAYRASCYRDSFGEAA